MSSAPRLRCTGFVVELKALESLAPIHLAQVLSYLKATRFRLGLLINFGVDVLQRGIKRVVRSP
jgi:GxxExxY protein